MSEPLYSSTAVDGWNLLPLDIKQQFYNIASKGEWTAQEAFVHLVPEELRDSPEKVELFMDGGTITTDQWVYDRGRAGGHYETVEHQIADKDVSRIEAGGEYSPDNTIMENASINRSRQAADMTADEYSQAVADNTAEVDLIQTSGLDSAAVETTADATSSFLESTVDFLGEVAPPLIVAAEAYKRTAQFTWQKRAAIVSSCFAGTAIAMKVPVVGPVLATGVTLYGVGKLTFKVGKHFYDRNRVATA